MSQASFKNPIAGPNSFVVTGSSGWPESFNRKKAEQAMHDLLSPHGEVDALLDLFALDHEVQADGKKKSIEWHHVLAFLARITGLHVQLISVPGAIAFWLLAITHETSRGTN